MRLRPHASPVLLTALLAAPAAAQFDNTWAGFVQDLDALDPDPSAVLLGQGGFEIGPSTISNPGTEVDFSWDDLDQDGLTDLVVVRKQPFTTPGKRTNILFMNRHGVLVDETPTCAVQSDVAGDLGFLTLTNDRDVVVADVDGDGLQDVVTATTLSDGEPHHVSHPRVYVNQGFGPSGAWQGLRYENARTPQLFTVAGAAVAPRFCSVDAGDVTGDGFNDLYFGDYDGSEVAPTGSTPENDLNDRLLINDGTGAFADESAVRMTPEMLKSAFGNAVKVIDLNLDGHADILKGTSLNPPQQVSISYNDPGSVGTFHIFDPFHAGFEPYFTEVGDLNNDGRPDLVVTDDFDDRYLFNQGVDPLGRVTWSTAKTFGFLAGGDEGLGGNSWVADLDGDDFGDVVITDVDVDIPGCNRRTKIYHNRGGTPGGEPDLVEERELPGDGGWLGAVGFLDEDLRGAHDVAVLDLENDGDLDIVLGRCSGTYAWVNQRFDGVCQKDLGLGGPGTARLSMCGKELATGNTADLTLSGAPPLAQAFVAGSFEYNPTFVLGGVVITLPPSVTVALTTDTHGVARIQDVLGGGGVGTFYVQAAVVDPLQPHGFAVTNALELDFLP